MIWCGAPLLKVRPLKFLHNLFLEVKSCHTSRTQLVVQAAIIKIDGCINTQLKLMETLFE